MTYFNILILSCLWNMDLDRSDRLLLFRIERQFVKNSDSGKSEALRLFRKCKQLAMQVCDGEKRKELLRKVLDRLTDESPSGPGNHHCQGPESKKCELALSFYFMLMICCGLFQVDIAEQVLFLRAQPRKATLSHQKMNQRFSMQLLQDRIL